MAKIYSLILTLLLYANLFEGTPCIAQASQSGDGSSRSKFAANFPQDTVLIYKYRKLATQNLHVDADKAVLYAQQILRLSQKHQWSKGKIMAYDLLCTYYIIDGSYDILREIANEILIISQKENLPFYTANAKRFLGETHAEYKQFDAALSNFQSAYKIYNTLKLDSAKAVTLENIGNFYREKLEYPEAIRYYDQAYKSFEKVGSQWGMASVLQNRGYLYVRNNELDKAEKYVTRALLIFQKLNNRFGILNALNDLGNVYYSQKRYKEAIETELEALKLSKLYHSSRQTNWALICLYKAFKGLDNDKQSLYYLEQVDYIRRTRHIERVAREYNMYKLIYENQQMDSEIQRKIIQEQNTIQSVLIGFLVLIVAFSAFLWFNNKKLRRKNAAIKEALIQGQTIERKRVAAELHDHLGGTLASLNWYLYGMDKKLLSEEEQKIYQSVHQMVGAAYREVRSLSHNLMPVELEENGLVVALQRLIGKLNENNSIQFRFDVEGLDKRLDKKVEFELYSILLELTNNILKHSKADKAEISLRESVRTIHLTISDNGNGIKPNSSHGVGLRNVKNRVQSLNGKIMISNEAIPGTNIGIDIPK